MKIIMRFNSILFLIILSFSYADEIDRYIDKAIKDSVNFDEINIILSNSQNINKPEYIFLEALIEFDGDSALKKYKNYHSKFPQHKYADIAVYEVGSYYYSFGLQLYYLSIFETHLILY